jgi:protoheme IX farnesyltransferase
MADFDNRSTTSYRRAAVAAGLLIYGLIVLGGVVRITGSGLGCGPSWPRCDGQWFPPLDLPTLIEIGHRWVAALVTLAVALLATIAWRRHREDAALRKPATIAFVLLVIQVLLGPVIVKLDLPPAVIVLHLLNAMVLLAVVVIAVMRTMPGLPLQTVRPKHQDNPLVHGTAGFGFLVILFGALVANLNAGLLCLGFPLCGGTYAPPVIPSAAVHWVHRVLAYALVALLVLLVTRLERHAIPSTRLVRMAARAALGLALLQAGVGVAMVLSLLPTGLRALHLATGTALWVALVVLGYLSTRAEPAMEAGGREAGKAGAADAVQPSLARDLVTLTKPRIISLLLVTTVAPMFITPAGLPSLALVLWVVAGGYLMAGGANAINMWFDRDIDQVMTRTRTRPLPSGRLPAWAALTWGLLLGSVAFAIFWFRVNQLSAWLALGGLLFYVFIYTMWLKRTSPQNIVIGGAAGAFPPLVGWAAMTGRIDLAAIYLFAIVFYWTPPHFWALALTKQGEYGKAGVPMMPVVHGDRYTKVQMLVYTLILVPLTIMPSVFGATGLLYGIVAALLGARFLWYCIQLLRETGVTPTAMKMFHFSLLYLALLFVAMGVDRAIPLGRHGQRIPEVIILDHPDEALAPVSAAAQP